MRHYNARVWEHRDWVWQIDERHVVSSEERIVREFPLAKRRRCVVVLRHRPTAIVPNCDNFVREWSRCLRVAMPCARHEWGWLVEVVAIEGHPCRGQTPNSTFRWARSVRGGDNDRLPIEVNHKTPTDRRKFPSCELTRLQRPVREVSCTPFDIPVVVVFSIVLGFV